MASPLINRLLTVVLGSCLSLLYSCNSSTDNTAQTDDTPPNAPIVITSQSSPTTNPLPTWAWTDGGGDGNGTYRYRLDNTDLSTGSTITTNFSFTPPTALPDGIHTLYVQERDAAGNWSSSGHAAITVNTAAPSAPVVNTLVAQTEDRTPTWNWHSGGGGDSNYRYRLDNPDLLTGSTTTTNLSYTPSTALPDGVHTLYVQERNAGNWSLSGSATVTIIFTADSLQFYTYNDHIDNDYDRMNVSSPTPMQWHDFDKDGRVRYDYDDSAAFVSYDLCCNFSNGREFGNAGNIGHPIHRYLRPALYVTFDSLLKQYPQLADGGRISLMKNVCRAMVDSFTVTGPMTVALKNIIKTKVCDSVSTVLKPTTTRPAHSDWMGGTPGVDEEMNDHIIDNDYDGLIDEDARNFTGYDDDGDGQLNMGMIASGVITMQWKDHNNNGCIDIDTSRSSYMMGSADSLARQFCIGTLENRLYLARRGMMYSSPNLPHSADSLAPYYSTFGQTNKNCIDQFNHNLDLKFRAKFQPTTNEANLACMFEHIWLAPRPPKSEWTGGVFGVDEEKCGDGIDNDGDGLVDEDCGSH